MKILMITPYVTIAGRREFERNKTGFGYMVYDIAKAIANIEQVDLFATWTRGESFDSEKIHFHARSFCLFLLSIFQCVNLRVLFKVLRKYTGSWGTRLRFIYSWLITGYLDKIIEQGKYDIVHIHGCIITDELWMNICKRRNVKFIVTLHGLNSFSETVKLESAGKLYERDFLKRVTEDEFQITVISTGMKRLIEQTYDQNNCRSISVVCNSFNFPAKYDIVNIKQLLSLPAICRIIVCVGNVCERKNQGQLIRAFELMPESIKQQTYILFLGGNIQPEYTVAKLSADSTWKSHFITCGVVSREIVSNYYEQCDAVALMSLSEGFGLSLIEGMHFGKPCMSFTDVDAYDDIYTPEAMIGVEDHSDESVAKGIEALLCYQWNKKDIINYSKKFDSLNMAKQYISVYEKITNRSSKTL